MYGPACECTVPMALLELVSHEAHVAFHTNDEEGMCAAFETWGEAGIDEIVLEDLGGSFGLLAN